MTSIYARTFMIATLIDTSEAAGQGGFGRGRRSHGWLARARRWIKAPAGD
jgi:hypothetical protein